MKVIIFFILVCMTLSAFSQTKLSDRDLENLVALSNLYSHNTMFKGEAVAKSADSLRTPMLSKMIDVLISSGKADTSVLNKRFLNRPTHDELMLWYVLRNIHYNNLDTNKNKPTPTQVAKQTLIKAIDERWLLDNYYYRKFSGVAMLFNTADLSGFDFNLNDYGLSDDTERAIFFFGITDALMRGKFLVLHTMKKNDLLNAAIKRLPSFNGKPYYYYVHLNVPDFPWEGYDHPESYLARHLEGLIETEYIQFNLAITEKNKSIGREIYFNSALRHPELFRYTTLKEVLENLFQTLK